MWSLNQTYSCLYRILECFHTSLILHTLQWVFVNQMGNPDAIWEIVWYVVSNKSRLIAVVLTSCLVSGVRRYVVLCEIYRVRTVGAEKAAL